MYYTNNFQLIALPFFFLSNNAKDYFACEDLLCDLHLDCHTNLQQDATIERWEAKNDFMHDEQFALSVQLQQLQFAEDHLR